uniref:Uncharacterized protein n=1 Tax=Micrurus corallinus TaxID=54390 RepID=A0A2D4FTR0_MICCO
MFQTLNLPYSSFRVKHYCLLTFFLLSSFSSYQLIRPVKSKFASPIFISKIDNTTFKLHRTLELEDSELSKSLESMAKTLSSNYKIVCNLKAILSILEWK